MTTVDAVKACRTPREAILALAEALDELATRVIALENVDDWDVAWEPGDPQESNEIRVERTENQTIFDIPQPAAEKMERRRLFERQSLKLTEMLANFPDVQEDVDWTEAYAMGGPFWLYQSNRELVMSYPEPVRRAMVEDVLEDSPALAHEMSIDVLKQAAGEPDFENGAGALAVGWITGKQR